MKNVLLFLLLNLGATGCVIAQTDVVPPDAAVYRSSVASDGVQHVRIEGGSYFFKPNHVIVRVNVPVELTVSVEGGVIPHNFVIQAPEAGIAVEQSLSSDARTIRFTPTAVGSYAFYCSKGLPFSKSHRERGMEGLLDVVE